MSKQSTHRIEGRGAKSSMTETNEDEYNDDSTEE